MDLDYRTDRIMVVNCQDTCGEAPGSQFVSGTEGQAVADYLDDPQAEYQIPEQPYSIDLRYTEEENRYCSGHNIVDGNAQITDNLCYNKCETDVPCTGDHCYCDGYFQGFDQASGALCLPRNECEHLCSLLGDACSGVDMHKELNRCFLNSQGCASQRQDGRLGVDTSYNFLFKALDQGAPARKLVHVDWESSHRGNLVLKPGVSTKTTCASPTWASAPPGRLRCASVIARSRASASPRATTRSRLARCTSRACTACCRSRSSAARSATSSTTAA